MEAGWGPPGTVGTECEGDLVGTRQRGRQGHVGLGGYTEDTGRFPEAVGHQGQRVTWPGV